MRFDPGLSPSPQNDCSSGANAAFPQMFRSIVRRDVDGLTATFADVWLKIVEALTEPIALLDEEWNILACNHSWTRAVEVYGHFGLHQGANYYDFLQARAAEGYESARSTVEGLEAIRSGKQSSFRLLYAGSGTRQGRDFQLYINKFDIGGRAYLSVTRYDITEMFELRRLREDFSSSVMQSQAEERRRLGREIHDSTMQVLASLGLLLGQLKRKSLAPDCQPVLAEMEGLLSEAQKEIRSISYLAHPPLLDKMTLPQALQSLVEGFGRRTSLTTTFKMLGDLNLRTPAAEGAIYRVVQEALSNVHRHANASQATIRLSSSKHMTHVVIADDGRGMPHEITAGVGLAGMRSRLAELGGRLWIRPRSPGTAVIASLPNRSHSGLPNDRPVVSSASIVPEPA